MQIKQKKSPQKRFIRLTLIVTAVVALIILGLHIWFVNNARNLIKGIVAKESKGKLKLELSQVSFDFLENKLQVREVDLFSTDSITQATTYRVSFRKLTIKTGSFWSLLFNKTMDIDSIKLHDPSIVVTQWKKDTTRKFAKDELSISQEMGKLYNSMLDGLDAFGIQRIDINNAKLSLVNKTKPGSDPITVSNIYFKLIRTADDTQKRDEFVQGEQTVDLQTTNQNIALPGGRHKLAFRTFKLQLFNKRIELDSCTVTAIAKDSLKSSYTIFFNKLLLVGVDFDAMYRYNLIKADSVYCENPLFDINLNTAIASSPKKERPDPEKIIQELTGDLELNYVGVKSAGIHINIIGKKNRSLFNSNKDDFEMRGLRINADSSQPVVVDRFDMLVRDYHLYNEDSSSAYTFDSIHFVNNKIVLNNFSVITHAARSKNKTERDFKIPYFELTGLDWYELIFNENLSAREAVMVDPIIHYVKKSSGPQRKKTNIFRSLQTLDDLITLNKITVVNGQIDMKLGPTTSLNLREVNLSLYSDRLLQSKNNEGVRKAIEELSFSRALVKIKDLTAEIYDARYTGTNLIHAEKLLLSSTSRMVSAVVNDVYIDNLLVDDVKETMLLDGLRWRSAKLDLKSPPASAGKKKKSGSLQLNNISGTNTELKFSNGKASVTSFISSLQIYSLIKSTTGELHLNGLKVAGSRLAVNTEALQLNASSYQVGSETSSYLNNVNLEQIKESDSLSVKANRIDFSADINSMLAKKYHISNLEAKGAVVRLNKWSTNEAKAESAPKPPISIDRIVLNEPDIRIAIHKTDSVTTISLPHSENSRIAVEGLKLDNGAVNLGKLNINTTSATLIKRTGEIVGVEKGSADIAISNLKLSQQDGKASWSALIDHMHLKNPNTFTLGKSKNKLWFDQAALGNFNISSDYLSNIDNLLKFNISAWLRTTTGQYVDSTKTLKWYNAEFNSGKKTLSLDSFEYHPTQSRDSVMAQAAYQTDYITLKTGNLLLTDFNLDKYEQDSALIANTMTITNPVITVYRDKKPPFLAGILKPLPVDLIQRISLPVEVQKLKMVNGLLSYSEKHAKTRAEGTLQLTHLNAELSNIKNRDITDTDSLTLTMSAYLMDSALIRLMVKESYLDSLSGFLMTLRLTPTTLSFLNPVLVPLSNVKITSGTIDSFHLRAIGHENLSIGEMKMYYHDLKIKLVKDGEENKSSFLTKAASWLANTFIIKKNNNGRIGIVYFERIKDRSFFNYIVKMTFSGMATSIGVKKNRKYIKQYKRELKARNLPPIDFQ